MRGFACKLFKLSDKYQLRFERSIRLPRSCSVAFLYANNPSFSHNMDPFLQKKLEKGVKFGSKTCIEINV